MSGMRESDSGRALRDGAVASTNFVSYPEAFHVKHSTDLIAFDALFRRWAARINLVAPSTLPDLWQRHILDSAQLARIEPEAIKWLDIGSGGGFPGAIMAVILRERPAASIDLVESNHKKAAFLQTALATAGSAGARACQSESKRLTAL